MIMDMSGQVAWVTGGATGIGLAAGQALARAGATVVLSGRRQAELDAAVAAIAQNGGKACAIAVDVSDASAVAAACARVVADHGRLDTLVCSAGGNIPNRYWGSLTPEAFARVTSINLNGVAFCIGAALPVMRAAGRGSIAVVSSWAGWRYTTFTGAAYGASKMGLSPLVESVNDQEGHHGIRATLICPGEVATPILRDRPKPPPEADIARMLKPEDVADAILYAVSAPAHVCLNEIVIGPVWNRIYIGADDLKPPRSPG
jgi:NAD(P)-dependent dehydrogenase (short-subunit alcohol dehydrogenase family)